MIMNSCFNFYETGAFNLHYKKSGQLIFIIEYKILIEVFKWHKNDYTNSM